MLSTRGPGDLAHANHNDLGDRLAALCARSGVTYRRGLVLGSNVFLGQHRCDLFLTGLAGYPQGLAIIARWQAVSGTADQKMPFLVESIRAVGVPTLIVLDGDGWREVVWLYLAGRVGDGFLGALSVAEFADLLRAQGRRLVVQQRLMAD